ncbi:MAG TPA: hypothetical protein VN886_11910 [Acidimicrobiales bacterium]|jgi:hypothetical protein|nr:hypothetical protein [Acidimicrobiales bacterium]
MIVLHILSLLFGTVVMLAVLGSALKTVVLPQEGFARLSQAVFALVYRLLVHRWSSDARSRALQRLYAPVSLVTLPLVWMILMAIAFTFIFWGTGSVGLEKAFEFSGSSLTTLGFAEPDTTARIWIAFIEAVIGLGLVALLISYLPTIFSAYNARERGIINLRPVAGSPAVATDLLLNLQRIGLLDSLDFWRNQADWMLDIEQTHTAFPTLTFFPETNDDHAWVATLGALLDAAALVASASETQAGEAFADLEKGPLMALVYGVPGVTRVARAANVPLPVPTRVQELADHYGEPAPAISIRREEYEAAMASLTPIVVVPAGQEEEAWRRFAWIRSAYDPPLRALAGLTKAPPAPWTTDRPAKVGRPRFLRRRPLQVDWTANMVGAATGPGAAPATGG